MNITPAHIYASDCWLVGLSDEVTRDNFRALDLLIVLAQHSKE